MNYKIKFTKKTVTVIILFLAICFLAAPEALAKDIPKSKKYTQEAAERMIASANELLNPVYAPLAKQLVNDYKLAELTSGTGIDLGSGPGNLIFELCQLTPLLHWINADINPNFFAHFFKEAEMREIAHQVSAIRADAQALPFRDNYADIIVSRGSYQFWENRKKAFSEIIRVLKPGGVAYIGRGFARDMPPEIARSIRNRQKGMPNYDKHAEALKLNELFSEMGITSFRIELPEPQNAEDLSYGIWIEIRAPE